MTGTYAKIIADSISKEGVRLTTMEVRFHRFVLSEFNTHRVFSRNSASSRAIPFEKQVERLLADTAEPVVWPIEQRGMQGGEPIDEYARKQAIREWNSAAQSAVKHAYRLRGLGPEADQKVHKSVVNRLLEPFMWHTAVVTSTAWQNFFLQRRHEAAQPEIRVVANAAYEVMQDAYEGSEPRRLVEGEWHLPYVEGEDWDAVQKWFSEDLSNLGKSIYPVLTKISAARCARVSYLTQDGKRDFREDLNLYARLTDRQQDSIHAHSPIHWSPLEHVATPWPQNRQTLGVDFFPLDSEEPLVQVDTDHLPKVGNLLGWRSLRTEEEARLGEKTFR